MTELTTERLLLRPPKDSDRASIAAMNADPAVMEHFPAPLTRAESDAMIERISAMIEQRGFGFWVAEARETGQVIGFIGLSVPTFEAPFLPGVEVGWRLTKDAWGNGYATEGARAALAHAFGPLESQEVLSFTATINKPSQRVMERLGMTHDEANDFDHPRLADGHPLQRHVLYRITRAQWEA